MNIILCVCIVLIVFIFSVRGRVGCVGLTDLRGWRYAHRGLYGGEIPENSLEAFQRAVDQGYGAELDVHLMADGELAVIHDSLLLRTTGRKGRVEELSAQLLNEYKLENTDHTIPLLRDVLKVFDGKAPLIIELKSSGKNTDALCRKTAELLDDYHGVYCVESFDPHCVLWFKKNRPNTIRGQLTQNYLKSTSSKLPLILKFIMRHQMLNFVTSPDFIAYRYSDRVTVSNFLCRKIWGMQGVTWTVKDHKELDLAESEGWISIFEGFEPQ